MRIRTIALSIFFFILGTISIGFVYAWSGPTAAPPGGNVAAPINVGSVDQVKNGGLGVNSLAVFGNSLLGGSYGSNAYLNFGATSGSSGYGIRDNAGTLEFKNDGGDWASLQQTLYDLCGGDCSGGGGGGSQAVGIRAHWSQSVSSGTQTFITSYQTVDRNDMETSTFSNGVVTIGAGEEGWYSVSADAGAQNANTDLCAWLRVNDTQTIVLDCSQTGTQAPYTNPSGAIYLNEGDTVRLQVKQVSGGSQTLSGRLMLVAL